MYPNFEKIYAPVLTGKENLNKTEVMVLCPFHRDKTPSMALNTLNGKYNCFACGGGSPIGFVMKYHNVDYKEALKLTGEFDENYATNRPVKRVPPTPKPVHVDSDYTDYCVSAAENVHNHYEFFCKKLYELRGLTLPTAVAGMIGYDSTKGWIIPIIRYKGNGKVVGYEIREKNFQKFSKGNKCYKAENSPSCLSVVYEPIGGSREAVVCEGFLDALHLYQHLHEEAQQAEQSQFAQVDKTILTPSMGVKTVPELVAEAELWNDFNEVLFILDNDEAGRSSTEAVNQLPHSGKFKFFGALAEGEDYEAYIKRVKNEL